MNEAHSTASKADGRLAGKRVLVTAAAQGIGEAIARAFAFEGAKVLATDINAQGLKGLAGVDGIETLALDACDGEAIRSVVESGGPFDVLASCTGYVHHGTVLDCDEAAWDFSFDLNIKAMYRVIRAVLPGMIEQGGGSIIGISSIVSSLHSAPNRCVYGASKAAVIGLVKSIAVDFVRQGIRINAICPGTVQSPSLDERIDALGGGDAVRQAFIDRQPMGRLGTAQEIAAIAVHLGSDESAFTTGQTFVADGGMSL
ncbi:SDR family oxidoreductase [Thioalkalivibrio sp. HK1]|uniref:SDR family oxidoreductase n=1 Tax=Thioalkalivibrio sp. HK1 TaxID=1469245 RepID=UPI00047025A6|nr:SDR family oxidoreductase [Thioalkalivibrio sp. HK1]